MGIDEKVAWTIPIKYKDTPFILTHRKFGFYIISNFEGEEIDKLGVEAINKINKAIPFAEEIFEPTIKSYVKQGKITLDNQFFAVHSRYQFFKLKAKNEFNKSEKNKGKFKKKVEKGDGFVDSITTITDVSYKYGVHGNNYTTAMLDAYFCLLEHIFVLLLPFHKTLAKEEIDLDFFISLNWREKLKKLIPLGENIEAQKLYEKINYIKEDLRNPLSHGYFLKQGHSFYVHVPYVGAIPMSLKNKNNHLKYAFNTISQYSFNEICESFESFYNHLKTNSITKYGIQYIETGLPIAFDKNTCVRNLEAMNNDSTFKEYIEYRGNEWERSANMDW